MEKNRHTSETESKKLKYSTLVKAGSIVSGVGGLTIANGIITQHGELGSVGALIGGAGIVLLLTAARRKKL